MNYIITNNKSHFEKLGNYNYCDLNDMELGEAIAVDTETTALSPLDGDMFSIQIGTGHNNYLIDMQVWNGGILFEDVIPYIEDKKMVFHNATFDLGFFYKHNFFPSQIQDTFIASKILYNGYPSSFRHGFGYVMERELGAIYDKSEQKNIHITQLRTYKAIQYCFNDVDRLLELMVAMWYKLKDVGSLEAYKVNADYTRALAYVEQCGLPLSEELWMEKMNNDVIRMNDAKSKVEEYIWEHIPKLRDIQLDLFADIKNKITIQITSPKQMHYVFEYFGIDIINEEGKKSVDKDIVKKSEHPFVKLWIDYQEANHDVTTYGSSILDKMYPNGRIYTTYNPILDTARISTHSGGINFLNFPATKETRSCFVAKDGYKMVVSDYSGQETVILADLSGDEAMVDSVIDGKDLHCAFARLVYPELENLSDEQIVKNHKDKRTKVKSPRFAFSYGSSGYTVAKNLNIPLEEGNRLETLFKDLHKGVYTWAEKVYNRAIDVGYIESVLGFKLHLPYFDEFKKTETYIDNLDSDFWSMYKEGKLQYKEQMEYKNTLKEGIGSNIKAPKIYNKKSFELYTTNKDRISDYFKKKGKYFRLCLNNPVQSTGSFVTKSAVIALWNEIVNRGDVWKAKICVVPHDEIVMEVSDELVDYYKERLGAIMMEEGNKLMKSGLVKLSAEANVGSSWYEAK